MKETQLQAYESPELQVVLLAMEQCIAVSDMNKNNVYEEDFD